jgi:hypothetical protein
MENRAIKVSKILLAIEAERQNQILKWGTAQRRVEDPGPVSTPEWKAAVLTEEIGEVAKAVVEMDRAGLKKELIHVAAVAVAWLEALD